VTKLFGKPALDANKQKKPTTPGSLRYAYIILFAVRLSEDPT
jgi:hypothetical protein